jgi:hypothetical protein
MTVLLFVASVLLVTDAFMLKTGLGGGHKKPISQHQEVKTSKATDIN